MTASLRTWSIVLSLFGASLGGCAAETPEINKPTNTKADGLVDAEIDALCVEAGLEPGCELCLEMGWYEDGICDPFCQSPDPACPATPPESSGIQQVDCAYHSPNEWIGLSISDLRGAILEERSIDPFAIHDEPIWLVNQIENTLTVGTGPRWGELDDGARVVDSLQWQFISWGTLEYQAVLFTVEGLTYGSIFESYHDRPAAWVSNGVVEHCERYLTE